MVFSHLLVKQLLEPGLVKQRSPAGGAFIRLRP
mgnify:CR=1 FL=1